MGNTLTEAINIAVEEAKATFQDANKNPLDHGHCHVQGIDGRTGLAKRLRDHEEMNVSSGGRNGTTLTIRGINRYYTAQRGAYDVFIKTLQAEGVGPATDMSVWGRRD